LVEVDGKQSSATKHAPLTSSFVTNRNRAGRGQIAIKASRPVEPRANVYYGRPGDTRTRGRS